jgi:hypothetical protein
MKVSAIRGEKSKLEALTREEHAQLTAQVKQIQEDYQQKIHDKEEQITHLTMDIAKLKAVETEKADITTEIATLKIQVESEKKEGMIEINDRERAKIYAVKKLSEEMDYKVKETQANLMALNDEQLHTTTRLTILQNHQLTTELDYQSKQTEQLLAKNDKM